MSTTSLQHAVIDRLLTTPTVADLLYGGLYDRKPRKGSDPAATPHAFDPQTGCIRPCASVHVDGHLHLTAGQSQRQVRVRIYQHGPDRDIIEQAIAAIYAALHHSQVTTTFDGAAVPLIWVRTLGANPGDPDLRLAVLDEIEFTAAAGPE